MSSSSERLVLTPKGDTKKKVGKYTVIGRLGKGAFGEALKCTYQRKKYVLKRVELSRLSESDRASALSEAKHLVQLSECPSVVGLEEWFEDDNHTLWICLDYCDGGDLERLIEKKRSKNNDWFSSDEIWAMAAQLCIALECSHNENILHRDVKAANVFLTRDGRLKLGDFGVAKQLEQTCQLAQTSIGTPLSLAPEVCLGEQYDRKADVWALGVLLFRAMFLRNAFEASNIPLLLTNITRSDPFQTLSEDEKSRYPSELVALLERLLEKDPEKRPDCADLLNEPDSALKHSADQYRTYVQSLNLESDKNHKTDELQQRLDELAEFEASLSVRDECPFIDTDSESEERNNIPLQCRLDKYRLQRIPEMVPDDDGTVDLSLDEKLAILERNSSHDLRSKALISELAMLERQLHSDCHDWPTVQSWVRRISARILRGASLKSIKQQIRLSEDFPFFSKIMRSASIVVLLEPDTHESINHDCES